MSTHALALRQRAQSTVSLRRKIVRTNSEERPSELKKSSTMTSFRPKLERLIQEGKIEHLLQQDPSSKAQLLYTNTVNEMEKELQSVKKSLSSFVIKARSKEQAINQVKNSIRKVERETEILRNEAAAATRRHGDRNEDLSSKKQDHQQAFWEEKVCASLKARSYSDEVFLKSRSEALTRLHDVQVDNRRLLENKYHELKQLNRELRGYRGQAEKIVQAQTSDKNEFIGLLERDMEERDLMGQLKADKYQKQAEINELAPSLIEREQLQRILEVLYAHRVLSQIIKVKSNSLIARYEDVSRAYNHIKSNSNIPQPDKILKRMEEHDKLYDDALKRVSSLEAQFASIQNGFSDMTVTKNEILSQEGVLQSLPPHYYQGLEVDRFEMMQSERQKLFERKREDEVLRLNIEGWAKRLFGRFGISPSESNSFLDCLTDLVVKIRQQK